MKDCETSNGWASVAWEPGEKNGQSLVRPYKSSSSSNFDLFHKGCRWLETNWRRDIGNCWTMIYTVVLAFVLLIPLFCCRRDCCGLDSVVKIVAKGRGGGEEKKSCWFEWILKVGKSGSFYIRKLKPLFSISRQNWIEFWPLFIFSLEESKRPTPLYEKKQKLGKVNL